MSAKDIMKKFNIDTTELQEAIDRIRKLFANLCDAIIPLKDIRYEEIERYKPVLEIRPVKNRVADVRIVINRCRNNC